MEQFILAFFSGISEKFYIYQVIAIMLLTLYGLVFMLIIRGREAGKFDLLLAYPVSLAVYSLSGYFILSTGIKFCRTSMIVFMLFILAITAFVFKENIKEIKVGKMTAIYVLAALILALISTSGIIRVSVLNDSMYYFSEYPRALVHYGKLNSTLDSFLTDAAQGIAIIGTIPAMFGFDEYFGIQTFLNINFISIFAYSIYDYSKKELERNKGIMLSSVALVILLTSMPFVIMARWLMANAFFMEYLVIVCIVAYKYSDSVKRQDLLVVSLLLTGLSIMRIEGALYAGVLVLCIMMLDYSNRDVITWFICPMTVLQVLYLVRIFVLITLHTYTSFMTKGKAIILIAFLIVIIIYNLLIRNRLFIQYKKYYPALITAGLLLVNVLALIYKSDVYLTNMKAYAANITRNSGWGLFVSFVIGVFILLPKKSVRVNFFDISTISYIMIAVLVGWARGDVLTESFGDSGNRVLIQIVPLMLFALCIKIAEGMKYISSEEK